MQRPKFSLDECYRILKINKDSNIEDIKHAYHKLALKMHPDLNPNDPNATKNFQTLSEAYTILTDALTYKRTSFYRNFQSSEKNRYENTYEDTYEDPYEKAYQQRWEEFKRQEKRRRKEEEERRKKEEEEQRREEQKREEEQRREEEKTRANREAEEKILKDLFKNPEVQRLYVYYTTKLRNLYVNEMNEILFEIRFDHILNSQTTNGKSLRHHFFEILADKLIIAHKSPSDIWLDTLFHMGNDPRQKDTTKSVNSFWSLLDKKYQSQMSYWLNEADINLFLNIARDGLYPFQEPWLYEDRKKLLLGLLRKGLVKNIRIFMGASANTFLHTHCHGNYKPAYTLISGNSKFAALYLDLGKAHLIDGVDNFKLYVFSKIPKNCILNPEYAQKSKKIKRTQLGKELEEAYKKEFSDGDFAAISHTKKWKFKALFWLNYMFDGNETLTDL